MGNKGRASPPLDNPYNYYVKPPRRFSRMSKVFASVLVLGIFYLVATSGIISSDWSARSDDGGLVSQAKKASNKMGSVHNAVKPIFRPRNQGGKKSNQKEAELEEEEEEDENLARLVGHKSSSKNAALRAHDNMAPPPESHDHADNAVYPPGRKTQKAPGKVGKHSQELNLKIKHVLSLMPDELRAAELIRPIVTSGAPRMRELGLKTRVYKVLLEAWEDLHLIHTEDSVLVRDDIISYLSSLGDVSGIAEGATRADVVRAYEEVRSFLMSFASVLYPFTMPYYSDHMTQHASFKHGGRGIVLSGGDGQLTFLMTAAKVIRKLGSKLPIEVMYLGDDDLGEDSRAALESIPDVTTRDMARMVRDEGWTLRGWAGKPFAMALSSFRECIFIDADAQFFVPPEVLFDEPGYEATGALFFKDRVIMPESKRRWLQSVIPKPWSKNVRESRLWTGESGNMQESGVVVVDKWKHFVALLLTMRMNGPDRDGNKEEGIIGTYDMVYGDKETFWLSWELVNDMDYHFHTGDAGVMGSITSEAEKAETLREKEMRDIEERRKAVLEFARLRQEMEDERARNEAEEEEKRQQALQEEARQQHEQEQEYQRLQAEIDVENARAGDAEVNKEKEPEAGEREDYTNLLDEEVNEVPAGNVDGANGAEGASDGDAMDRGILKKRDFSTTDGSAQEYEICAPQLLHLDLNDNPLWFNGWIMKNKYDQSKPELMKFEHYMSERRSDRPARALGSSKPQFDANWKLGEANKCCLTNIEYHEFTDREKQVLKWIEEIAIECGALESR